ncbi:MAG TPA: VWA domain-containing protein [Acidimicrobiales bacterium]|nr:VWA domain-containing protein [Acidimicrobiales bacterium]
MTFRSPSVLAALVAVPVLIAAYAVAQQARGRRAAALAAEGLVATTADRRVRRRRHVPFALVATALTVLIVGLARPTTTIRVPRREATVVVAIDVSNSMAATDTKPSRIAAAKAAAVAFVTHQPPAVRVGVVAFGNGAVVVHTPATGHTDAVNAIERLSLGGGTSVGQGILTSLDAIAGKQLTIDESQLANDAGALSIGYYGSATIVVFSDGENVSGPDPAAIAQVASVAGVRVHTIGVGTPAGTVVQINGFSVATALHADVLQQIATVTNASYHSAGDATGLASVARSINLRFKLVAEHTEVSALFAAAGAALLLLGAILSALWSGRVI